VFSSPDAVNSEFVLRRNFMLDALASRPLGCGMEVVAAAEILFTSVTRWPYAGPYRPAADSVSS